MRPGSHIIVLGRPEDALELRASGLQLRDTFFVMLPGSRVLFAYLFRKPLEGTVVENVLEQGLGGLWIDGCRLATNEITGHYSNGGTDLGVMNDDSWQPKPRFHGGHSGGRWPTNLLFVHGPGCVLANSDWKCQSDCPVKLLDAQSGETKSPAPYVQQSTVVGIFGAESYHDRLSTHHGDAGGASRFFPQFENLPKALDWLMRLIGAP